MTSTTETTVYRQVLAALAPVFAKHGMEGANGYFTSECVQVFINQGGSRFFKNENEAEVSFSTATGFCGAFRSVSLKADKKTDIAALAKKVDAKIVTLTERAKAVAEERNAQRKVQAARDAELTRLVADAGMVTDYGTVRDGNLSARPELCDGGMRMHRVEIEGHITVEQFKAIAAILKGE